MALRNLVSSYVEPCCCAGDNDNDELANPFTKRKSMNISTLSSASTIRLRIAMSAMLIGTILPTTAHAQMAAPVTDPVELGIMQGFPPLADKLVTKANSLRFPNLGWALRNTRVMMPTANVEHARVPMPLPVASTLDPDKVQFTVDGTSLSLSDYLRRTYTDGFIVIHDGKVVYEGYFNSYTPHQTHAWASMTKSVTGLIATQLIDEGKLNPEAKLSAYVPELAGTAFTIF